MPSDEAAAFVDARFRELIAPGERTLGLLCRGTDYFTKRPYKHQIQPTVAQIIEKTDETLAAHPVDKIFVATEDEAILAALKAKYGGKLVYVECPRLTAVQGQSASIYAFPTSAPRCASLPAETQAMPCAAANCAAAAFAPLCL